MRIPWAATAEELQFSWTGCIAASSLQESIVRIAILRISMSSAIRRVAGVSRLRKGVMWWALLGKKVKIRPLVWAFIPSIAALQKCASPYNRNLLYNGTSPIPNPNQITLFFVCTSNEAKQIHHSQKENTRQ